MCMSARRNVTVGLRLTGLRIEPAPAGEKLRRRPEEKPDTFDLIEAPITSRICVYMCIYR